MSGDIQVYPDDWREYLDRYGFKDKMEYYTNGNELVQVFRVVDMVEHYFDEKRHDALSEMTQQERLEHTVRFMLDCMITEQFDTLHPATWGHILRELKRAGMDVRL